MQIVYCYIKLPVFFFIYCLFVPRSIRMWSKPIIMIILTISSINRSPKEMIVRRNGRISTGFSIQIDNRLLFRKTKNSFVMDYNSTETGCSLSYSVWGKNHIHIINEATINHEQWHVLNDSCTIYA